VILRQEGLILVPLLSYSHQHDRVYLVAFGLSQSAKCINLKKHARRAHLPDDFDDRHCTHCIGLFGVHTIMQLPRDGFTR